MSFASAFLPAEMEYRARVVEETWGHLAATKNKTYRGHIVYALGCFDSGWLNPTALECKFEGLLDSPWLYDAVQDFLSAQAKENREAGEIYRFEGTVRNYEFKGKITRLKLIAQ